METTFKENIKILLTEKNQDQLPGRELSSDEIFFCAHIGPSMNPTLTARDLLEIKPYGQKKPKVGDVILFHSPSHDFLVVHRIIKLTDNTIRTRGDNNSEIDSCFLKKENIYGRVIAVYRGERRRTIANGFTGSLTGKFCQLRRITLDGCLFLLGPLYRFLSGSTMLNRLMPIRLSPQVASFHSGTNASHKLLLGKKVIGFYDDKRRQWQIKRPYRIIVDEASLPAPH